MQNELSKPLPVPWQPYKYMTKGVKFLLEHAAGALFLDPGLGKTSVTLAAIKILKKKKLLDKVLVIAPLLPCYKVWPVEAEKWKDFNGLTVSILHGPKKEEALKTPADIYVINPDGLEWLLQIKKEKYKTSSGVDKVKVSVDMRRWKNMGFDILVIDELSKFKHTNTARFKALKIVLETFDRRWGLTGSPASNGLMDLFGQCYVLDQGRTLGRYITHYRLKYFDLGYNGYTWSLKDGADKQIYTKLKPLVLRMAAEDYLDMPQVIENTIYVDLPDSVMKVYDQLEKDLIARLDDRQVVAANAAVASGKCRQVANGGVYLDPQILGMLVKKPKSMREWANLHTEKVDALADLIDELQGEPLLVAYDFNHDLDRLRTKLGKDVPYIGGGVSMKRSSELIDLWNARQLPVLLGHPQSIGHGLNLQDGGYHVCWHSLTWDYGLYDQFNRRLLRQGNKSKKVFVHHIIAKNTIDEVMMVIVKSKRREQNALFTALQTLRR